MKWHLGSFALLMVAGTSFIIASGTHESHAASVGTGPSFKGPIGLQLYSLREQFATNGPGTLDEVKSFGIKYVELWPAKTAWTPQQFREELKQRGITAVSSHFPY